MSAFPSFAYRTLRSIAGREPMEQLGILQSAVEQGQWDRTDATELNVLRRQFIRIVSELYLTRIPL